MKTVRKSGIETITQHKHSIANKGYVSLFQKERKCKGLAPEGVREVTVPSGPLLRSWSEIVEVKSAILQSYRELVSSIKKNGTVK